MVSSLSQPEKIEKKERNVYLGGFVGEIAAISAGASSSNGNIGSATHFKEPY
jgi:hypothetical protein